MSLLLALFLVAGCENPFADADPPKNCDPRIPFWPDADGDGVGDEGSSVYLGCVAPEGYVDEPPPSDTDADTDVDTDSDAPSDTLD